VAGLLGALEAGREEEARRQAAAYDHWTGEIVVSPEAIAAARAMVPPALQRDILAARDNVLRFAAAQRAGILDVEIEVSPGVRAGHRNLPLQAAGCYVPGGRYAHIASAIMGVTTAKAAGVKHVVACSPPLSATGIHPAQLFAMDVCGADVILKATKVDGIYDADPKTHPEAKKYDRITYTEALQKRLQVMDSTAFSLCMDNKMPIVVFDIAGPSNIKRAVTGEPIGTLVTGT
jgi:hypothetical protein